MHRIASTGLPSACRQTSPLLSMPKVFSRPRTSSVRLGPAQKFSKPPQRSHVKPHVFAHSRAQFENGAAPTVFLTPSEVPARLRRVVEEWRKSGRLFSRLCRFGVRPQDIRPLLDVFVPVIKNGDIFSTLDYSRDEIARIAYDLSNSSAYHALPSQSDAAKYLTKLLFEWVAHPTGQLALVDKVSPATLSTMSALFEASNLTRPWALYRPARGAKRRKVVMHVGPTNSGKTHNALRALAAAPRGVYAGPLRLLAHEIWDRLNKGQIVPAGADPGADAEPDRSTNVDVGEQDAGPVVRKEGDARYARECNMVTGEEQKIVREDAGLLSCTVEMVPTAREWDVAVVDEIQLIADPERGGAWTTAVLGLNAAELHLCGEETAVPLVREMLRDTGDELVVHRYERLTPLQVADSSLRGDLSRVEKGDCVVTFSRKEIFALKKKIEKKTNMRCAVAYGRLPPEIRSEQAALFNTPGSGYDVLVGSDAIGMGLNLKIKRIIFETVHKFDGTRQIELSMSQTKQIAGRAGRYGLHGQDKSGGVVTTLEEADLPFIRRALVHRTQPLKFAVLQSQFEMLTDILDALPHGSALALAMEAQEHVGKLHPKYALPPVGRWKLAVEFVDSIEGELSMQERFMLHNAPTPLRDELAVEAVRGMMQIYSNRLRVGLEQALQTCGLWDRFIDIKEDMESSQPPSDPSSMLSLLETLHKVVVEYLWLSYRTAVAFPDQDQAITVRDQIEKAMDWCLEALTTGKGRRSVSSKGHSAENDIKYTSGAEMKKLRMKLLKEKETSSLVALHVGGEAPTRPQLE